MLTKWKIHGIPLLISVLFITTLMTGCSNTTLAQEELHPDISMQGSDIDIEISLPSGIEFPEILSANVYQHTFSIDSTIAEASNALGYDLSLMEYEVRNDNTRIYSVPDGYCHVEEDTGYWTYNSTKNTVAVSLSEFISDDEVVKKAKDFLSINSLWSSDAYSISIGTSTSGGWTNAETITAKSAYIYPSINGISVYGVYRIILTFDANGNIFQIYKTANPVKEHAKVSLKSQEDVISSLAKKDFSASISTTLKDISIESISLAYYADSAPNENGEFLVYPVYVLLGSGTTPSGGNEEFDIIVDAVK